MVKELLVKDNTDILTIIEGCKNQDKLYQSKLYVKYFYYILNICKNYTNNIAEAEDLTQDIYLKITRNIGSFIGKTEPQFTVWVKTLSKNSCIDYTRRRKKFNDIDEENLDNINSCFLDIDSIDNHGEIMINDINLAVSKLAPQYKTIFQLFYLQNYSHKEIADELGINIGTSKSNLYRAKLRLSQMLKHYNNSFN